MSLTGNDHSCSWRHSASPVLLYVWVWTPDCSALAIRQSYVKQHSESPRLACFCRTAMPHWTLYQLNGSFDAMTHTSWTAALMPWHTPFETISAAKIQVKHLGQIAQKPSFLIAGSKIRSLWRSSHSPQWELLLPAGSCNSLGSTWKQQSRRAGGVYQKAAVS